MAGAAVSNTAFPSGGAIAPGFEPVRDAFMAAQQQDDGGAQLCVYRHGKQVVDLWAGWDPVNNRPYGEDTIGVIMSCTKGAVAIAAHMLAERGLLDFDAPVARYWPAFAQNGKADIRVHHLMDHSAGLMGYDPETGMGAVELFDWERSVAELETMEPLWEPGTANSYHFVTYGTLVGEVVRRISGKTAGRFIADEIAGPLGLDLWVGLPEGQEARRAPHFRRGPEISADLWRGMLVGMGVDVETRLIRCLLHTVATVDEALQLINTTRHMRAAELPAGNGIANARALARMYAATIGEVAGVRLINDETVAHARAPRPNGPRPPAQLAAFGNRDEPQTWGLGFELTSPTRPMFGPGGFGHSGAGGRIAYAHPESGIAVGYVCNTMWEFPAQPDPRWVGWSEALRQAVA